MLHLFEWKLFISRRGVTSQKTWNLVVNNEHYYVSSRASFSVLKSRVSILCIICIVKRSVLVLMTIFNTGTPQFMTTHSFNHDVVDKSRHWLVQCARLELMLCLARLLCFRHVCCKQYRIYILLVGSRWACRRYFRLTTMSNYDMVVGSEPPRKTGNVCFRIYV